MEYQAFYCEENAWWLCADPALGAGERWVVFVVAGAGRVPMLAQRAAPPGRLIAWDYHVVVVDAAGRVWDQDTRLPLPCDGSLWCARSFARADDFPAVYRPRFRVVPGADFRRDFVTDRRHMRDRRGRWLQPPPPWPPPGADQQGVGAPTAGSNLAHYLDPRPRGTGRVLALEAFQDWLRALGEGTSPAPLK